MENENSTKKVLKVEGEFNGQKLTLETGKLANAADASVLATLGGTSVLATVVSVPTKEPTDFFPLKIDYEERFYAGGIVSGSRFTRREGRPTDEAVVEARLIDHAMRPLFPKDFMDDTQIVVTVLSSDAKNSAGLLGFLATSAALSISGLPFSGPIVPLRIRKHEDGKVEFDLHIEDEEADLDMVVSYLKEGKKVQAIEARANVIAESEIAELVKQGGEASKPLFDLLNKFAGDYGAEAREYTPSWLNRTAIETISADAMSKLQDWHKSGIKFSQAEWDKNLSELAAELSEKYAETYSSDQIAILLGEVQKDFVRKLFVEQGERVDGRKVDEIRPLSAEIGLLPRVHGSGLFTRGRTQSLTIATLAPSKDTLLIQDMHGDREKSYFHHYNFPPFSTGEVGKVGGANRRAIGHGMLAEKALRAVLPKKEEFPYVIRTVSEILSSNGSTSMAATCGSSLALMDAGVPIKAHVAGIGVGLFVVDPYADDMQIEDYKFVTDIIGYEDFSGYMDFKMTGTREGMTAIQMELKLKGLPVELFGKLFEVSKTARMQVIDVMDNAVNAPKSELSEFAPRVESMKVDRSVVGQIIGSGGATIKDISMKFDVTIDIEEKEDHALVVIAAKSQEALAQVKEYITSLITPVEVGQIFEGVVTRVEDYGAFVEVAPKQTGLLHVSEYSYGFTEKMGDHIKLGDKVRVKVIGLDHGKISVSKKALEERPEGMEIESRPERLDRGDSNRDRDNRRSGFGRGQRRDSRDFRR